MFIITIILLATILFFTVKIIYLRSPLNSAISFILIILGFCVLLFQQNLSYASFTILLVYLTGFIILIVFVIFVFDNTQSQQEIEYTYKFILGFGFLVTIFLKGWKIQDFTTEKFALYLEKSQEDSEFFWQSFNTILATGNDFILLREIYTDHCNLFVVTALLLLLGVMGSIIIISDRH